MVAIAQSKFAGGIRPVAQYRQLAENRQAVRARYDNYLTTDENYRNWWPGADYFSAKAANSYQVRRILRMRSRYEMVNNPYLFGICNSNADDLIDSGPTLQVTTSDKQFNKAVEAAWNEWCQEVDYVEKLRTCKLARTVDGEGFLILKTVNDLENPVKLYPVDVEADQVTTPQPQTLADFWVDGLTLHKITGKPTHYHVLKHHPGDFFFTDLNPLAYEVLPARYVIQWFPKFRPGQVRGIPVFTSSLDLFTELRAYRRAVLKAAEIAADFAAVIESELPGGLDNDPQGLVPFSHVRIDRGMMTNLPYGYKMNQFDPKQPVNTYESFQQACLGEAARPLNYPLNRVLGSSQKFNFSSAKMDFVQYFFSLKVERKQCDRTVNHKVFRAWFEEAVLSGAIPLTFGINVPPHQWHWPGFPPIDKAVDGKADLEALAGGADTYKAFWATRGEDWEKVFEQQAIEKKEQERLGLTFSQPIKQTITQTDDEEDQDRPKKTQAQRAKAHRQNKLQAERLDSVEATLKALKDNLRKEAEYATGQRKADLEYVLKS